jgi:hypothetical protein
MLVAAPAKTMSKRRRLMPRAASGQIVEVRRKRGKLFAIRFRAYGRRHYVTLDTTEDGWTRRRAREELDDVLAQVRLGIWQPRAADPEPPVEEPEPTFHEFASEWLAAREREGLSPRTIQDYRWALTHHLLPFFQRHKLGEITPREVDRYKAAKAAEGAISANSTNKTPLYGGTGKDRLFGRGGADVLKGGRNNDKLYGNGDRDRLYGQSGNDKLVGGSSRGKLYGGNARDLLVGGAMKDTLDGGSQKDTAKKPGHDLLVSIEVVVP